MSWLALARICFVRWYTARSWTGTYSCGPPACCDSLTTWYGPTDDTLMTNSPTKDDDIVEESAMAAHVVRVSALAFTVDRSADARRRGFRMSRHAKAEAQFVASRPLAPDPNEAMT
jgi:hypothetical protein